ELSQKYGFKIIEDASHAIGGKYLGKPIGGCEYSDITVFSFHPVKIITTAEGGVAVTNEIALVEKMNLFRSHGITRNPELMAQNDGGWYYQQIDLGYNYRMTELQAALGLSQLGRLNLFVSQRNSLAQSYDEQLKTLPVITPFRHPNSLSSLHLYVIRLNLEIISISHQEVFEGLRLRGIGVNLHYIPIHTHPFYQNMGFKSGDFPHAELYYQEAISLPMFPALSDLQQRKVVMTLEDLINGRRD
ncbi:MAG: dTDP-4-amino-4,6-dideoxygalactose transaminase, partial [Oleiphilaceae bacterium]